MTRVKVVEPAARALADAESSISGLSFTGDIQSFSILGENGDKLQLWRHELQPGTQVEFADLASTHVLFVYDGEIQLGNQRIEKEGSVIVEHSSAATLVAGNAGATVLQFFDPVTVSASDSRLGGNVHAYPSSGKYSKPTRGGRSRIVVHADADCSTCDVWLHRSVLPADTEVLPHYHTEGEIIFLLYGTMIVGNRTLSPGSALSIEQDTIYSFKAGPDGLDFLNFRSTDPSIIFVKDGKPVSEPISEREILTETADAATVQRLNSILGS